MSYIKTVLIDARNAAEEVPRVMNAVHAADWVGLDIETEDSRRHEGLKKLGEYDDAGFKKAGKKLIFDARRTTVCGFSVYPDGADTAWYINLAHADEANRVPWQLAQFILEAKKADAHWICHNAVFELTMLRNSLGYHLSNVICTLQMAVSTYGPDEYNKHAWRRAGLGEMKKWVAPIEKYSQTYDGGEFTGRLADVVVKIIGKESRAKHSYNGFCKDFAWGYGLKQAVRSFFGVEMSTFEETLGENAHMGQLTGEQVAAYGAEDAYWAVRLFHHLLKQMGSHAPNVMRTFFEQENPMTEVYSDIWTGGMRVDLDTILKRKEEERALFAATLRGLKAAIRDIGGFDVEPEPRLLKREDWYVKNGQKYRDRILGWAGSRDLEDDYLLCQQVRSAVSNAWAKERGEKESAGLNLTHYMPVRVLLYDLIGAPMVMSKGKLQSNGEARGKSKDKLEKKIAEAEGRVFKEAEERLLAEAEAGDEAEQDVSEDEMIVEDSGSDDIERARAGIAIIDHLGQLARIEQRMKLYITPYQHLTDPETSRMYPVVSSQLAARRMAASYPNPMQLAKRGESVWIRNFYRADNDEHVIVGIDWSAIELVIIGELSGDPEFVRAYGQVPHQDLHAGTAAAVLQVEIPQLTEADFVRLKLAKTWTDWQPDPELLSEMKRIQINLKGELMEPQKAYSYWRTEIGKGANFNYWYSGFLGSVGDRMGWSGHETGTATQLFKERFPVAENWRVDLIEHGKRHGWIELPDGHRRNRWEATDKWFWEFMEKWEDLEGEAAKWVVNKIASKLQRRAHNQLVNSMVQGTCATIAKRSILRLREALKARGWGPNEARFMIPIHDELVFSVRWDLAAEFIEIAYGVMCDHPEIFKLMKLDAAPSMGLTMEPYGEKAPFGQIELYEPPAIEPVAKERVKQRLTRAEIHTVAEWLNREGKEKMRRAA